MLVALTWSKANFLATKRARHVAEKHLVETLDAYMVEAEALEQDRAAKYEEDMQMDQTHFWAPKPNQAGQGLNGGE
jgi:hypothetical protein